MAEKTSTAKRKPDSCWYRFSMRTLLLVVFALCVALAAFELATRKARKRRELEATWMRRGAIVFFNDNGEIDYVAFTDPDRDFTSEDFRLLRAHPEITILGLDDTRVTDADLQFLNGLPKLRMLLLTNTQITDTGVAHLANLPSLRFVILPGTRVTDEGLEHLLKLPNLRGLNLENTQVTQQRIDRLRADAPKFGLLY